MRAPAPVQHPVAHGGFWWAAWQGLALLAGLAVLAWLVSWWRQPGLPWRLTCAAALAWALVFWSRGGLRRLLSLESIAWDGLAWRLRSRAGRTITGRVELWLDFGPWMLLRWRPDAAGVGCKLALPVARSGGPDGWQRLRLAVQASPALPGLAHPTALGGKLP